jgi:hypothetical protein
MDSGTIWRVVLLAIVAFIAIRLVMWVLNIALGLLSTAITIAVIVGVIWLLVQIFSRKQAF